MSRARAAPPMAIARRKRGRGQVALVHGQIGQTPDRPGHRPLVAEFPRQLGTMLQIVVGLVGPPLCHHHQAGTGQGSLQPSSITRPTLPLQGALQVRTLHTPAHRWRRGPGPACARPGRRRCRLPVAGRPRRPPPAALERGWHGPGLPGRSPAHAALEPGPGVRPWPGQGPLQQCRASARAPAVRSYQATPETARRAPLGSCSGNHSSAVRRCGGTASIRCAHSPQPSRTSSVAPARAAKYRAWRARSRSCSPAATSLSRPYWASSGGSSGSRPLLHGRDEQRPGEMVAGHGQALTAVPHQERTAHPRLPGQALGRGPVREAEAGSSPASPWARQVGKRDPEHPVSVRDLRRPGPGRAASCPHLLHIVTGRWPATTSTSWASSCSHADQIGERGRE